MPVRRPDHVRPEPLAPFVEELAERVRPLHRRLDVHDPVGGVRVQPVKARSRADERSGLGSAARPRQGFRSTPGPGGPRRSRRSSGARGCGRASARPRCSRCRRRATRLRRSRCWPARARWGRGRLRARAGRPPVLGLQGAKGAQRRVSRWRGGRAAADGERHAHRDRGRDDDRAAADRGHPDPPLALLLGLARLLKALSSAIPGVLLGHRISVVNDLSRTSPADSPRFTWLRRRWATSRGTPVSPSG